MLNELEAITGIKPIEWASLNVPVLAIPAIARGPGEVVEMRPYLLRRKDLAEKLGLDPKEPFGLQLHQEGKLTAEQAIALDNGVLKNHHSTATFKVRLSPSGLRATLANCHNKGLIKKVVNRIYSGGICYLTIETDNFSQFCKEMTRSGSEDIMLTSLNGAVLAA